MGNICCLLLVHVFLLPVYVSFSPVGSKHLWDTGGLQTVLQETVGTPHPTCAMHRRPAGKRNKPNPRRHEGMSPHLVMHCVMRCQSLAVEEGADRRCRCRVIFEPVCLWLYSLTTNILVKCQEHF